MSYENLYVPVLSIPKPDKIEPGGLCRIMIFKMEDVLEWPEISPLTGCIETALQLKPGKVFYQVIASEKDREFDEELKRDGGGDYHEGQVTLTVPGNSVATTLSFAAMARHRWGLILRDRGGQQRLVGSDDSCARISYKYTSGSKDKSRLREIRFLFESINPSPIYLPTAWTINIGGVIITAGTLQLVASFVVNDPGAPMAHGDVTFIHGLLADRNILFIADGLALPVDDGTGAIDWTGSLARHIEKTFASDTVNVPGGVTTGEIIQIYAYY
jgi:hypothetical protein